MDEHLKQAVEIVKAQAAVRVMTEEEISSMVSKLATSIHQLSTPQEVCTTEPVVEDIDTAALVKNSIKEKSVTCLECGKTFKIITKRHLEQHGLTTQEYLDKYNYKKGTRLVCKSLQRERKKRMKEMQLWERRRNSNVIINSQKPTA